MATTIEAPLGNQWAFSQKSFHVYTGPGSEEIPRPVGLLAEVVSLVQEAFIVDGWQFRAVVQTQPRREDNSHNLTVIFTHPLRTGLLESWTHDVKEFLRLDQSSSNDPYFYDSEKNAPINEKLRGTNFVVARMHAGHSGVNVGRKSFWQTGVGFFI